MSKELDKLIPAIKDYIDWDAIKRDYNLDDNIDFVNPFSEKFDLIEIIDNQKLISQMDNQLSNKMLIELKKQRHREVQEMYIKPDNLNTYQDELKAVKNFKLFFEDEETNIPKSQLNQFKDFLDLPVLSKISTNKGKKAIISSDSIYDDGHTMQFSTEFNTANQTNGHRSEILINKNKNDEIESIEVACACGEKTLIVLKSE